MKRIVTMQDISCIGKCSLTAALPVISAMGIETAVLPTAVLSTHTMFQSPVFHDLTPELRPIIHHWKREGFSFDAIYTGYLGSSEQLSVAAELFQDFPTHLKLVDPCMGDNGKLYAGFTPAFASEMKKLCAQADVICPNLTEASYLVNIPYKTDYDEACIQQILQALTALGADTAVLTGVSLQKGKIGAYGYNRALDKYYQYYTDREEVSFHGTGDIWASVLCGALVNGKSFQSALSIACRFVRECIHLTLKEKNHNTYGVNFEQAIPFLLQLMQKE